MSAASSAREASPDADITVFTEDVDIAYSPCAIPWGIEGRSSWDEIVMHTPEFYAEKRNIRVITGTRVEAVDGEAFGRVEGVLAFQGGEGLGDRTR